MTNVPDYFGSMEAINREALRVLKLMGYEDVKRVTPSVGPEQEYWPYPDYGDILYSVK